MTAICATPEEFAEMYVPKMKRLERRYSPLTKFVVGLTLLPACWYLLIRLDMLSRPTLKKIRKSNATCTMGKVDCEECMEKTIEGASRMRNHLRHVASIYSKHYLLAGPYRKALDMEDEWASLVEDLTLSADKDFRALANELSHFI